MKKLLTIIATAFIALSVSAQSEAGSFTLQPNVGFTYTTPSGDWGKGKDGGFALTAGVEGMYMVNDKFGAALGLNFTGYNISQEVVTSLKGDTEDLVWSNYYFNVPVTANFYVAPGLALKAGIAMNILSTAKLDGKSEAYVIDAGGWKYKGLKPKEYFKSTFFSLPVGASYEINNFVFDLRYNFGLGKAFKGDGSFNALSFTVGYKF